MDVTGLAWRKSRRSMNGGNCVEAAVAASAVLVRDTKDLDGFVLAVPAGSWRKFTAALQDQPAR
jgi:hypothetical protein